MGKSVSLQMLLGFLKPDKGMIKVAGGKTSVASRNASYKRFAAR